MSMQRSADRDEVWKSLVKNRGDREKAAKALGISVRTLNRYIKDYNLYADMDRAGFVKHPGPPRADDKVSSKREDKIKAAIRRRNGELDYGELAIELYGEDTNQTRQRVYVALNDLKLKGAIALDGVRWFVM